MPMNRGMMALSTLAYILWCDQWSDSFLGGDLGMKTSGFASSIVTLRFASTVVFLYAVLFGASSGVAAFSGLADGYNRWDGSTTGASVVMNIVGMNYPDANGYIQKVVAIHDLSQGAEAGGGMIGISGLMYYFHYDYNSFRGTNITLDMLVPGGDYNQLVDIAVLVDEPFHTTYRVDMYTPSGTFSYSPSYSFPLSPTQIYDKMELFGNSAGANSGGNGAWSYNQWIDNTYTLRYQDAPFSPSNPGNTFQATVYPPISVFWYSYPPANNPPGGTWLAYCCS